MKEPSSRFESDEARQAEAAGKARERSGCRKFLERLLVGVLLVSLIFLPVLLHSWGFGILGVYLALSAFFAFMAWCVYSTYRGEPGEDLQGSRLDVIDIPLVIATWILVFWSHDALHLNLVDLLIPLSTGVMGFRRRLFPGSVVPYHPSNLALRVGSIFCGIYFPITVCFGVVAMAIDSPAPHVWSLFSAAGVLFFLTGWFHWLEYRREARRCAETPSAQE